MGAHKRPEGLRKLMQTTEASGKVVTTAKELAEAVSSGAEHIELQSHLDLTELNVGEDSILGYLPAAVKTIRVRHAVNISPCGFSLCKNNFCRGKCMKEEA